MSIKVNNFVSLFLALIVALSGTVNAQDEGLVGYWKFDDEGTGTIFDYSGNDRHGTINGEPQFVPGLFGDATHFTGDPIT